MAKDIKEKTCFVIMGFGKKKDPDTNRMIDLDETYIKIIRPASERCGYRCIRADEVLDPGIIDKSMYELLYGAELVIADISTFNPNAIYELGTRHILRPASTIIIREDKCPMPFDFNHNRILSYVHKGKEISESEAEKSKVALVELINAIPEHPVPDSPIYSYIPHFKRPRIRKRIIKVISKDMEDKLKNNEDSIFALIEKAKDLKSKNRFTEAAKIWEHISERVPDDIYYVQQQALCTYKSESPNKIKALTDALEIIAKIKDHTDAETLGLEGAINKRLWIELKDVSYLDAAIEYYKKGWCLHDDYYPGENYAFCLEQKYIMEKDPERKTYYLIEAKDTRNKIIDTILKSLEENEPIDLKWKYATLSNCYLAINNSERSKEFEQKFMSQSPDQWEIKTFNDSKNYIIEYN